MKTLIYLHGFNSSPQSLKAKVTLEFLRRYFPDIHCYVPQLPISPAQAQQKIQALLAPLLANKARIHAGYDGCDDVTFIGSSLGGYYANYWVERLGCKSVMINPAVHPDRLLKDYLGPQKNDYSGEETVLTEQHMKELNAIRIDSLTMPSRRMVLLQSGDETLDFLEASDYYSACKLVIENGGDHTFIGYDRWLARIAEFLNLSS